jgi:hypothetical protein
VRSRDSPTAATRRRKRYVAVAMAIAGVSNAPLSAQVFLNIDEDCEGPELLFEPLDPGAVSASGCGGLRAVLVQEHEVRHRYFPASSVPSSVAELKSQLE